MDKKRILEGLYSWAFVLLIIGGSIYFAILPNVNFDFFENFGEEKYTKEDINEAYQRGYNDGLDEGYNDGYDEGRNASFEEERAAAYEEGFSDGEDAVIQWQDENKERYEDGYEYGLEVGYSAGYEDGFLEGKSSGYSGTTSDSGTSNGVAVSGYPSNTGGNTYYGPVEEECDYVLNKSTGKFHKPTCSSTTNIKQKNREYFTGTREEVIARGFDPCKKCNP